MEKGPSLWNDRAIHLLFSILYLGLGLTGTIASFVGWFPNIHNEFIIFFTNQSNILAVVASMLWLSSSILDLLNGKRHGKERRFVSFSFCVLLYLLVTMVLYNVFAGDGHLFSAKFWSTIQCPILHLFAPLLYSFFFVAFVDKNLIQGRTLFTVLIFPLLYSAFILIRSFVLGDVEPFEISGYIRFPYPLYDYVSFGPWLTILFLFLGLIGFVAFAFLFRKIFQIKRKAHQ